MAAGASPSAFPVLTGLEVVEQHGSFRKEPLDNRATELIVESRAKKMQGDWDKTLKKLS